MTPGLARVMESARGAVALGQAVPADHARVLLDALPSGPAHPPHLLFALWTDNETGELVLTNQRGEVFHLPAVESPHLAVMLADHCDDNDERWHVRSEWADLEDDDEEGEL